MHEPRYTQDCKSERSSISLGAFAHSGSTVEQVDGSSQAHSSSRVSGPGNQEALVVSATITQHNR
jgi:hypothetical protein